MTSDSRYDGRGLRAVSMLPLEGDVQEALAQKALLESRGSVAAPNAVGEVLRAAALDSAYAQFTGKVRGGSERPVAVGALSLLFDTEQIARQTFLRVAEAAHLRTSLGSSDVAVETVTAPTGMVSYWGYLQRDRAILVVTLDTFDPQEISMSDFRSLVTIATERLERAI